MTALAKNSMLTIKITNHGTLLAKINSGGPDRWPKTQRARNLRPITKKGISKLERYYLWRLIDNWFNGVFDKRARRTWPEVIKPQSHTF